MAGFTPVIHESLGYSKIYAADIDAKSIAAAQKLATGQMKVHFSVDDCILPCDFAQVRFDVIDSAVF